MFLGEFELPNTKYFKTDTNILHSPEILTSDIGEDVSIQNNKASCSKSIFLCENKNADNCNEEDYLSWVSHIKGINLLN